MSTGDHNAGGGGGGGGGGLTLGWNSIPSRGSSNFPSRFTLRKPELSATWLENRLYLTVASPQSLLLTQVYIFEYMGNLELVGTT